MTLYKLTTAHGEPVHGGSGVWSLPRGKRPGAWRSVPRLPVVPCENGLHLMRVQDVTPWLRPGVLWEAEAAGAQGVHEDSKVVAQRARLVRKVGVLDERNLRLLAADFAERVLPIFEKRYPDDPRPRRAIEAARAYARGEITLDDLRAAAAAVRAAAYAAAAHAAHAAAAYAYAYDYDYAAAYAAAAAADAAAEREWQGRRVLEVLAGG